MEHEERIPLDKISQRQYRMLSHEDSVVTQRAPVLLLMGQIRQHLLAETGVPFTLMTDLFGWPALMTTFADGSAAWVTVLTGCHGSTVLCVTGDVLRKKKGTYFSFTSIGGDEMHPDFVLMIFFLARYAEKEDE